jgi:Asp-tRNA(Asn)/Glu-tRNA(Gln) amidotransferase A subunit family amidase
VQTSRLHGVPVTIKDAIETAGLRITSVFPPLADYIPTTDAPVVARLQAAGAIILGKTNLPTLAGGTQTDNPIFVRTNNPWDIRRTPGGSTGGGGGGPCRNCPYVKTGLASCTRVEERASHPSRKRL